MPATLSILLRFVVFACVFASKTHASSESVNLDYLTGRQFFAYDSFRPFCYSVIIGSTIRQETSSSTATCNSAGFGRLGAILNLGSYNGTASMSHTQSYHGGDTCGRQGQSVSTSLQVFSQSGSTGITATLTQPTACQYSLALTGPVTMFSTTTVTYTSSSTNSITSTVSDTFTSTTTVTISSITLTTSTQSTATTTSFTLSSSTSSSKTMTSTRITSTSATNTSVTHTSSTRTRVTHTSSTRTSATTTSTITSSTTSFICTTPMPVACPACQESSIVLPMVLVFFVGVSLPILLQGGVWLCQNGGGGSKVSPGPECKDQDAQTETEEPYEMKDAPVFEIVSLMEPEPIPEPAAEIPDVARTASADLSLDVEHVLISVYPTLKNIFQYYSYSGSRMSKQQFSTLLEDCQLASIPRERVEAVFDQCSTPGRAAMGHLRVANSQGAELAGMLMVSEQSGQARFRAYLGISEFVNSILYFAWERADHAEKQRARGGGPQDVRTALGKAFHAFIEDELKPLAGQADNCMSLRNSLRHAPAKGILAKSHINGILGRAFKYHADARSGLMSLKNFDRWTRRAGLLSNERLSSQKLRECFIWAADKDRGGVPADWRATDSLNENTKVFTGPDCSKDAALTEIEFSLAFARIAHIMFSRSNDITPANLAVAISQLCNELEKDAAYPEDTGAVPD